jgi:hypothetical protein
MPNVATAAFVHPPLRRRRALQKPGFGMLGAADFSQARIIAAYGMKLCEQISFALRPVLEDCSLEPVVGGMECRRFTPHLCGTISATP